MRYLTLSEILHLYDQEQIILDLAAGKVTRQGFAAWLKNHIHHINIA